MVVESYPKCLHALGLQGLDSVLAYQGGDVVKMQRGHRDVFRLSIPGQVGRSAYLKRNLKPYKKNGLASLLMTGRVRSSARQEVENFSALSAAGLHVPTVLAWGDRCNVLWEDCSFIITEAAAGVPADQFFTECREPALRRRVLEQLAQEIALLHTRGLASRDLFVRHVFIHVQGDGEIRFTYIDLNRLNRRNRGIGMAMRARDLANLNLTAFPPLLSASERLRFFKAYCGGFIDHRLLRLVRMRIEYMFLKRRYAKPWNRPRPNWRMSAYRAAQAIFFFAFQ